MATIVGGLRARLIWDSVFHTVDDGLRALGWYDNGRQHLPIIFHAKPVDDLTEIPLNSLALADESETSTDFELGSNLAEHRWIYYVDFYAEDDTIGRHLIYDVRDILGGRMPSIGRGDPSVAVLDYRQATPTELFVVQLEGVGVDRAKNFPKPWQRHWYACSFTVVDAYGSEWDNEPNPPAEYFGGF